MTGNTIRVRRMALEAKMERTKKSLARLRAQCPCKDKYNHVDPKTGDTFRICPDCGDETKLN